MNRRLPTQLAAIVHGWWHAIVADDDGLECELVSPAFVTPYRRISTQALPVLAGRDA